MITVQLLTSGAATKEMKQKLREIFKRTFVGVAKLWHAKYLPLHFKGTSAARYGYVKRDAKYEQDKQRFKHHRQPLVWSTKARDKLTGFARFTETGNSVKVVMSGPRYLDKTPKKGSPVPWRKEVTAVTGQEMQELASDFDARLQKEVTDEFPRYMIPWEQER